MEQTIENIRLILKEKLIDSISEAFFNLNERLPANSKKFNQLIVLNARHKKYKENFLQGIISQDDADLEHNKIVKAVIDFIDLLELDDFVAKDTKSSDSRLGKVCFRIAQKMQLRQKHDCKIWIAFDEAVILEEIKVKLGDDLRDIRISDTMGVELFDEEDGAAFEIKTYDETVQPVEEDFVTQWNFKVTPLKVGIFPLILKIAVVIERRGKELKKTIVLEEKISIVSETLEEKADDKEFAGTSKSFQQLAVLPLLKPATQLKKPVVSVQISNSGRPFWLRPALIGLIGITGAFIAYKAINRNKNTPPDFTERLTDSSQNRQKIVEETSPTLDKETLSSDSIEANVDNTTLSIKRNEEEKGNEERIAFSEQETEENKTNQDKIPTTNTNPNTKPTTNPPTVKQKEDESSKPAAKEVTLLRDAAQKPVHPQCSKRKKKERRESCTEERIRSNVERMIKDAKIPENSKASVRFVIQKNGKIGTVRILRSDNELLSEKILEALEELPIFEAGRNKSGQPINVIYTLPVRVAAD